MKPQIHRLPCSVDTSFLYNKSDCKYFSKQWHLHKEYELVWIRRGWGTRFIGDNVSHFEEGDLALIGSNIPHLFRNSEEFYTEDSNLEAGSTFIQFTDSFLGNQFFNIPEMKQVSRLLEKSAMALEIYGDTRRYIVNKLHQMLDETPAERLLSLLAILVTLSLSRELKPLMSAGFPANRCGETQKINNAFEFIMKNYTKQIYVVEIASRLNMSIASFSRYFKYHTHKTFSDCVTEIRIGHACRLLMEDNYSISEICYESGFDNHSNFYRHFKRFVGVIPKEYRNRFLNMPKMPN